MTAVDRAERVFDNLEAAAQFTPGDAPSREPLAFHQRLRNYKPTSLVNATSVAARLGCDRVWVKNETERLGLPAFKIMGASWAIYRALRTLLGQRTGTQFAEPPTLGELNAAIASLRPLTLTCATDGNHGRAVAHMAKLLDLDAHIFVPGDMDPARVAAIASEGATVTKVAGTYDDAVARSAEEASDTCLVISDTSWPGYVEVPSWVIEGYASIFWEIEDQLAAQAEPGPTLVAVQIGVGALAAAVVRHVRRPGPDTRPEILGVEPARAACVLASIEAGEMTLLPGPHDSIMSGLNAGLPSAVAWPWVSTGIDTFIAVDDRRALDAIALLQADGIAAGETGAAGLAGVLGLIGLTGRNFAGERLLLICTEGWTGSR
jgi:diaminopropionate ammonia-lyase